MNNDQFRKLAFGSGTSSSNNNAGNNNTNSANAPKALGSRQKASIPMTPRHGDVSRVAFARQMAERYSTNNHDANKDQKPKFRTSRPRGTKFAEGYVDRAKLRAVNDGGEDTATKGLDFDLLHRAKEGGQRGDQSEEEDAPSAEDVDDEFERIEDAEVQAIKHEKTKKKGQYSTVAPAAGQKRSRDQILAEMKAAREAAKQAKAAEPALGSRFKKIGAPQTAGSRIEIDSRGREVLILVDEDGHEKRKVRKAAEVVEDKPEGPVLGMEVPEFYRKKQEAEAAAAAAKEVDIFDDVGSDYDPLAGMDDDEEDSDEDEREKAQDEDKGGRDGYDTKRRRRSSASGRDDGEVSDASDNNRRRRRSPSEERQPSTKEEKAALRKANYFGNSTLLSESTSRGGPSLNDPSVLAALRKAKQMREATESEAKAQVLSKEAEREARLKKLLQSSERDAEDLDMGFGANRLDDTEDMEGEGGKKVKLSKWRSGDLGGDDGEEDGGKRKRGGKKRKGDENNADDVMRVRERRREEK
ncbi:hypothetical protein SEUCBS139899_000127 [Sporothrix eucalyptigena]|uniref:Red-like protein n=1 Tax=Sporothrix eucalyptigena TaxID=1812306 RepID=A0ABP0C1H7_9PEZI